MDDIHIKTNFGEILIAFRTPRKEQKKRDFEQEETQNMLETLNISPTHLSHNAAGKPLLSLNNKHISISHSQGWFAIYVGDSALGIDIQVFHDRLVEGTSYFINEKESQWKSTLELHLVWAAKEAIYKKYGGEMKDLAQEVTVESINFEQKTMIIHYAQSFENLIFLDLNQVVVVYTLS